MLSYFPKSYDDELLYSIIARYHIHTNNIHFVETARDLFNKTQVKAIPDFPTSLNELSQNLKVFKYPDKEYLIENNTMYFYYTNFSTSQTKKDVKNILVNGEDISKVYRILGIMSNKIKENNFFKFCPDCLEDDINRIGESYWYRSHQLPSSYYCLKHNKVLLNSQVNYRKGTRSEFKAPSLENCLLTDTVDSLELFSVYEDVMMKITRESIKLATKNYNWDSVEFYKVYHVWLNELGYLSATGKVNQIKFGEDFKAFYGNKLLSFFNCELKIGDYNCWLRLITSKPRSIFHPLKHLLILIFFNKTLEDIERSAYKEYAPFGTGNYPCLNRGSDHFKALCIEEVVVSREHNQGGKPRGLFKCSKCEFTYSRVGPDKSKDDIFRYNKVVNFGPIWEESLRNLVYKDGLTHKEAAMKLNVSVGTIGRYLKGFERKDKTFSEDLTKIEDMKNQWLDLIEKYPNYSQKKIRNLNRGLYSSLYAHDKDWLQSNSPKITYESKGNRRVDWETRDKEFLIEVKLAIDNIESSIPPIRITVNRIEVESNIKGLGLKMKKLPLTKEYILSKVESIEQYQIKRVEWAIAEIRKDEPYISLSKVLTKANLHRASGEVINAVKYLLEEKQS